MVLFCVIFLVNVYAKSFIKSFVLFFALNLPVASLCKFLCLVRFNLCLDFVAQIVKEFVEGGGEKLSSFVASKLKRCAHNKGQKDKSYEDEESNLMVVKLVGVEDVLIHISPHFVAIVNEINSKSERGQCAYKFGKIAVLNLQFFEENEDDDR